MEKSKRRKNTILNELKSGGCVICGYDRCMSALAMHHVDPFLKSSIGLNKMGWENFFAEVKKCVILCHNCHTEVHNGLHPEYLNCEVSLDVMDDSHEQAVFWPEPAQM